MHKPPWWLLARTLLGVIVLLAALWVLGGAARRNSFDGDENLYMWRGRYFGHLFLRQDIGHPEWGDSYWTHSQPMLTNYVVGGWLWAQGHDLEKMPPPYLWGKGSQENRRQGRVPDRALLAQARAPMVVIGAGAVVLLYLLGCSLGSTLGGLTAATLALVSPLTQKFLVRAVGEPLLGFFLLLSLLLAVLAARRARHGAISIGWAVAVGATLGLGLSTKLTVVLSVAAVLAWMLLTVLAAWHRAGSIHGAHFGRAWTAGRGWAVAVAVSLGIFVLSNPHLYPNPGLHTAHLFQNRFEEMVAQQRNLPGDAVDNPLERVWFVLQGSLIESTATGSRGLPLEAALATIGGAVLLARTWRGWRRTSHIPAEGLVLVTVLAYFVGVTAGLLLAWPHYLVPTFLLGTVLSGLGLSAVTHSLVHQSVRALNAGAKRRRLIPQGAAPR
jgi:4-amino-4-deoxy-L-arabinose transferase-like glycosyltransferase